MAVSARSICPRHEVVPIVLASGDQAHLRRRARDSKSRYLLRRLAIRDEDRPLLVEVSPPELASDVGWEPLISAQAHLCDADRNSLCCNLFLLFMQAGFGQSRCQRHLAECCSTPDVMKILHTRVNLPCDVGFPSTGSFRWGGVATALPAPFPLSAATMRTQ